MSISTNLNDILHAIYGKDVRQAIHDGIEQCYEDVTSPTLNLDAFREVVEDMIDNELLTGVTNIQSVNSTSAMTDHGALYVYNGDIYYWNGSAFSTPNLDMDTTLLVAGSPADAKAVGDRLSTLSTSIPSVDTTLNVTGAAADSKTVGTRFSSLASSIHTVTFSDLNNDGNIVISIV